MPAINNVLTIRFSTQDSDLSLFLSFYLVEAVYRNKKSRSLMIPTTTINSSSHVLYFLKLSLFKSLELYVYII